MIEQRNNEKERDSVSTPVFSRYSGLTHQRKTNAQPLLRWRQIVPKSRGRNGTPCSPRMRACNRYKKLLHYDDRSERCNRYAT